jgi:hypothetical protein
MDLSKPAQDVRALALQEGLLFDGQSLEDQERAIGRLTKELGRVALQQQLDSDPKRSYEGSSRVCSCGQDQKFVRHAQRTLKTLLGPVVYTRAYYRCPCCKKSCFPEDQKQGLGTHNISVPLAKAVVCLAEAVPYRLATDKLKELLDVEVSASTVNRLTDHVAKTASDQEQELAEAVKVDRHGVEARVTGRLYNLADGVMVHQTDGWHEAKCLQCRWQDHQGQWQAVRLCRLEKVEAFADLAHGCMHACGLENCRESVLIGDGGVWIWNHLGAIADEAIQVLDWYHAAEHVWALGKSLYGEGSGLCREIAKELCGLLWESKHQALLEKLEGVRKRLRSKAKRDAIVALEGYIKSNQSRMDYKKYREMGLVIGSGAVESDCKNLVHARLKRGSPRWSPEGCQHMLSLRSCFANGQQERLWAAKPLRAA